MVTHEGKDEGPRTAPSVWLAVLLFIAVFAVLFAPVLSGRATVVHGDALSVSLPLQQVLASSLARGTFPLWSDEIYGGHPLFAEGQGGFAHPLNLLLFGVLPRISSGVQETGAGVGVVAPGTLYAHGLLHVLCGLIAALGTYGLCRTWGLGFAASAFAALALAASQDWLVQTSNAAIAISTAGAPLVLLAIERWWREPTVARSLVVSLGLTWMLLGGYPQAVHGLAIFALVSLAARIDGAWLEKPWRHVVTGLLAIAIAFGLSAVQLLPTLELVGESVRAEGVGLAATAMPAEQLRGLLFSIGERAAVDPSLGSVFVLGLALLALRVSRPVLAFGLPSLLLFQLSMGEHSSLYRALHHTLPLLDSFRIVHLYSTLSLLGVAVLAGFGLQRLGELVRPAASFLAWAALVGAGLAAVCFVMHDELVPAWTYMFPALGVLAGVGLLATGRARIIPAVLLGVLVFEIGALRLPLHDFADVEILREPPPTVRFLLEEHPSDRDFKIANVPHFCSYIGFVSPNSPGLERLAALFLSSLDAGSNLIWSIPSVNANLALPLARRLLVTSLIEAEARGESAREPGRRFIDAFGVRYFIVHNRHRKGPYSFDLTPVFFDEDYRFYVLENPSSRPRLGFYAESDVSSAPDRDSALAELRRAHGAALVVEGEPLGRSPANEPARDEPAVWNVEESMAERYTVEIHARLPGYFFVSDSPYPGWKARVDGEPTPVRAANVLGKAVAVPAGTHRVEVFFEPDSFRIGWIVTSATAVLALALACWSPGAGREHAGRERTA